MRFPNILGSLMAHLLAQPFIVPPFMTARERGGDQKRQRVTTKHSRNGKREVARRRRQIAAGQLTRSNGLRTAAEVYGRKAA